jgi:hypothetical protein
MKPMKRYAVSFGAPLAFLYLIVAFAQLDLTPSVETWDEIGRGYAAFVYLVCSFWALAWPGWRQP